MKFINKLKLLMIVCVIALVGGIISILYYGATSRGSPAYVEVEIVHGSSVKKIANELAKAGVISQPRLFEVIARLRGIGRKLRAGSYEFPAGTTLIAALGKIERGEVHQYPFTVIEGWTVRDIAAALVGQPFLADASVPDDFVHLVFDKKYIASQGFNGIPSLEGYLFPDTYFLTRPTNADVLIKRMVARFREVWGKVTGLAKKPSNLTELELVTLASIVEKETGVADERPLVASVFYNRLRQGISLQSDPTIIYGLPNFNGNIRKGDITNPHPYNTYVHAGLPPGPICNPGQASIEAVLRPAESDYLYFVSRNNGTHQFSQTLAGHNDAVRIYQTRR